MTVSGPQGFTSERCTGVLVNPVYGTTYDEVFWMTLEPS